MTQKERTTIFETMSDQFMQPVITEKGEWFAIDGTHGLTFITADEPICNINDLSTFDSFYEGTPYSVERVTGYGARLSAPGYMDCTDWCVFPTIEEAEQYLVDTYGDDIEVT